MRLGNEYLHVLADGAMLLRLKEVGSQPKPNFFQRIKKTVVGEAEKPRLLWRILDKTSPKALLSNATCLYPLGISGEVKAEFLNNRLRITERKLPDWVMSEIEWDVGKIRMRFIHLPSRQVADLKIPVKEPLRIRFCITPTKKGTELLYECKFAGNRVNIQMSELPICY